MPVQPESEAATEAKLRSSQGRQQLAAGFYQLKSGRCLAGRDLTIAARSMKGLAS